MAATEERMDISIDGSGLCWNQWRTKARIRTSRTSQPPRLTPRTFWEPYGKLGLMGLSPNTAGAKSTTRMDTDERADLRVTMAVVHRPVSVRGRGVEGGKGRGEWSGESGIIYGEAQEMRGTRRTLRLQCSITLVSDTSHVFPARVRFATSCWAHRPRTSVIRRRPPRYCRHCAHHNSTPAPTLTHACVLPLPAACLPGTGPVEKIARRAGAMSWWMYLIRCSRHRPSVRRWARTGECRAASGQVTQPNASVIPASRVAQTFLLVMYRLFSPGLPCIRYIVTPVEHHLCQKMIRQRMSSSVGSVGKVRTLGRQPA